MKLEYKELKIEDVTFYVARSMTRKMHITVKKDGKVYAVRGYFVSNEEFYDFLIRQLPWTRNAIAKTKAKTERVISMTVYELRDKISRYVMKYQQLMNVSIKKITIKKMTTAWGSCTKRRETIRFSTELMKCTDDFIEYVVVHEMAHLIEANHSKRFWDIVVKYIPNYKELRKKYR